MFVIIPSMLTLVPCRYTVAYAAYHGAQYDASTTNLSYSLRISNELAQAEAVDVTLSFLSPITPTSTLRQAIPAAYLEIHVQGSIDVSIYVDVNGQWVSGKSESLLEWSLAQQENPVTTPRLKDVASEASGRANPYRDR